ncbi:MAG: hypothetical protein ABWY36_07990 [Leifsonia sp.]
MDGARGAELDLAMTLVRRVAEEVDDHRAEWAEREPRAWNSPAQRAYSEHLRELRHELRMLSDDLHAALAAIRAAALP